MASVEKQRDRLITLLGDLFQLNQPDLDFGFYRIMHAKADRVSSFLQNDLLKIIKDAFGEADEKRVEEARLAYEAATKQAKEFGAPNPEETEPVKKAKAAHEAVRDAGNGEGEIYDHLFRFFERYYDNGDFMSRRYYARETDGKAAPYSIPYDGREVYLHWANRDQYYIKTSEYLTNFTFNLANAPELKGLFEQEPRKVHCRIVDAAEGEHGNVKTTDKTERYFLIHKDEPVKIENGDLVIQFEYRPDAEKSGQGGKWQEKRIEEAEKIVLEAIRKLDDAHDLLASLSTLIGKEQNRTLLRRYLTQYTSRNTMDYFIHKDLGGFLRRELDFYIKNEIMRLDDIESADTPRVEFYLSKIKVLRKIAHHLIDFLAQLEDFQKKLWLKKKFVVETNYCITLDRIPESFYAEIAANDAQREEWVKLFAIDELEGHKKPLSAVFLKENPFLVLDTAFFDETFKAKLLAEIQNLDEKADGLLLHSDNFQALNLIDAKMKENVKTIFIDPPYNTENDRQSKKFIYKDGYADSSWIAMVYDRILVSYKLLGKNGLFFCTIDDNELFNLKHTCDQIFGSANFKANIIWNSRKSKQNDIDVSLSHNYVALYSKNKHKMELYGQPLNESEFDNPDSDPKGKWKVSPMDAPGVRERTSFFPIVNPNTKEEYYPPKGRHWTVFEEDVPDLITEGRIFFGTKGNSRPQWKRYWEEVKEDSKTIGTIWDEIDTATNATKELENILGHKSFETPKPSSLLDEILQQSTTNGELVIDYFAGSGTTAHAALNKIRAGVKLKYLLCEMGDYFDKITLKRVIKNVYSKDWRDGKPVSREGVSHCFKYIRLETYEDALNNLVLRDDAVREDALAKSDDFRREYMLNYWLEFETKGSPSLLNVEQFADPTAYMLKIKKPGSDEYTEKSIDLIETFNWLIGLHVDHIDAPRTFDGKFKRETDPELPNDQTTRLILDGKLSEDANGKWWFRKVEGRVCRTPGDKKNMDKVLIIWRKLTGNLEEDNLMLDEWFRKYRLSTQDTEFDVIYVNGSNNLPNLKRDEENWKVRLIEETFHQKMWDVEG
ncbi:MAG: site-specific DNA-methyltransferase [Proteobacteria bacterium]|nr:site-specific DNA-methyltransferase [Pseudomonadota bacterium]